jgi:acyl-coenzyme A synthetase/AMP-(fatty) acid ligase
MFPQGAIPGRPQNGCSRHEIGAGGGPGLETSGGTTDGVDLISLVNSPAVNVIDPILRHGRVQPATIAVIDDDRTITYRELAELVLRTTGHLCALGVKRGDYVGVCLKDDWEHVVALLAIARLGATVVQINPHARPTEKARIAAAFDLRLILALPGGEMNANCGTVALDSTWHRRVAQADVPGSFPDDWHDAMVVQTTAGTTGLPKFTVATHLQFYLRLASYPELMPATSAHRYLATLPLFFGYGRNLCLLHLLHGATLIFYRGLLNAAGFVDAVTKHQVTIAAVVPSTMRQLLDATEADQSLLPGLELLLSSGAPLFADEKRKAVRKLTPNFHEFYAASALGPISVLRPKDIPKWADSVGRPFTLADIEIVDDDDRPVVRGETGRLRCRGPALASPVPGHSADDFRNGWHYPGELAALDECGYIHLHGRTSEVIFRGGAKIFATEIEAALQSHEKVTDAAVVAGAASGEQEVVAYVIAKGEVTPGQLLAHCRQNLTPYKVPRQIHIVPELPRNSYGKVDKRALASQSGAAARANA